MLRGRMLMWWEGESSRGLVEGRRWVKCKMRRWERERRRVGRCGLSRCWRWRSGGP